MVKVFLVDDEIVIREGIRNSFPWEESGYTLVGEAPDGEIALPMIRDANPDILIRLFFDKRADSFFFLGIHVLNMPHYLLATSVSFYYRGTMKKHFTSKHKAKSFLLRSIEPFNLQRKGFL